MPSFSDVLRRQLTEKGLERQAPLLSPSEYHSSSYYIIGEAITHPDTMANLVPSHFEAADRRGDLPHIAQQPKFHFSLSVQNT